MELQLALSLLFGLIGGLISSWLAFRIRFERFEAMDEQREEDWSQWRKELGERMNNHANRLHDIADHRSRIERLERRFNETR